MAEILTTLVLVLLAVLVFVLFKRINVLEQRLSLLSDRIANLHHSPTPPPPAKPAQKAVQKQKSPPRAAATVAGPWTATSAAAPPPSPPRPRPTSAARPDHQPGAFVFREDLFSDLFDWLRANWFLAIAALSLALSGVFLVQYGVEHGVVTPFWRVIGAAALGIALIWFGEFVRHRAGRFGSTAYLPSTFSGAGVVALFSAVLAAEHLYGLVGPGGTMVWLILVSAVAVVLGWYYGPFLSVVGILGSTAAPFLVGGESELPQLFYYYFALIAAAGLAVDALKRWAWVSAFALIFTFGGSWMIFAGDAGDAHFLAFTLIATALAATLPMLSLTPRHDGGTVLGAFASAQQRNKPQIDWPTFPTRLAEATFAAACGVAMIVALKDAGPAELWLSLITLAVLYLAATLWFRSAPALQELALLPPVLFIIVIVDQAFSFGTLFRSFVDPIHLQPEAARPTEVTVLAAIALAGSALAHWRGLFRTSTTHLWSAGAALFAPLVLVVLELFWSPSPILGAGWWAGHAMIVAAAMVLFAGQTARRDGEDHQRTALYALAAMTVISMALILVLSSTALTLALGAMVLGAALVDARLNLRPVTVLIFAGAAVTTWRLIIDPGIDWADDAPLWEVLLAYLGSAALYAAATMTLKQRQRTASLITAESTFWLALPLLASVLLLRWIDPGTGDHAQVSLHGLVWLLSALNQIYRLKAGGPLTWVRIVLASLFGLVALLIFMIAFAFNNPLAGYDPVVGPLILDSLLVAYVLPALTLAFAALRFTHLRLILRSIFGILAALFATWYVALEIRRFWHGRDLSVGGVLDGELYSYTVALLLASVALLFIAFWRRSHLMRKIAVAGVTLTIAKVFLIDMSGLAGLYRVASFLGLGLSLASLAWIARQMAVQWDENPPK